MSASPLSMRCWLIVATLFRRHLVLTNLKLAPAAILETVSGPSCVRKILACLCVAVILSAALIPGDPLLLLAILVPLGLIAAVVPCVLCRGDNDEANAQASGFHTLLSSRAPPVA